METLCCILNNQNVYLEQILVEYDHVPVFMIGKDDKNYYLIICSEIEKLHYIIVKTNIVSIYKMLIGHIPMRDLFLSEKNYWDLISGEDLYSDTIEQHSIEELDNDFLPVEGAYYKIVDSDVEIYALKLLSIIQQKLHIDKEHFSIKQSKNYLVEEDMSFSDFYLPKIKNEIILFEEEYLYQINMNNKLNKKIKYKKNRNSVNNFFDTNTITKKYFLYEKEFAA